MKPNRSVPPATVVPVLNVLCHRTGSGSWGVGAVSGRRLFIMPSKDLKRLARARMAATGERYIQALTHVLSQPVLEPLAAAWVCDGQPRTRLRSRALSQGHHL